MKIINHPVTLALGITTLCLLFLIGPLLSPSHALIYHLCRSATPVFLSLGVDFCFVWLLITGLPVLAKRYPGAFLPVWLAIVLFVPWIAAKNAIMLEAWPISHRAMVLSFLFILAIYVGLLFLPRTALNKMFLPVQSFASVLLGFTGLAGMTILIQFVWSGWEARNLNPPFAATSRSISSPVNGQRQRVVWILLDELSYRQVYERRLPGLQLPAFDRLAEQSVVFTHVVPAGIYTERVLPALFTGMPAGQIRVSADGQLRSLQDPVTGTWQPFSQYQTVFQDARAAGYTTGIAGSFNPYCRILPQVLDKCYWQVRQPVESYVVPGNSWLAMLASPVGLFSHAAAMLRLPGTVPLTVISAEKHIEDFKDLCQAGDALITDPDVNFVFLHMPIPHPEGIYDRKQMKFVTAGSSYLDNLVLADEYLAHVRLLLEAQNQWDSSTVVVMGDHSWRTILFWKLLPEWTAEEEQASQGGKFDDRPAYIVKMPMQEVPLRMDTPFPAVRTRAFFDAVIDNHLQTGQDLTAWAEERR